MSAPPRKCAHPAGCELLAADGDIYCEGCATDPMLGYWDEDGPNVDGPVAEYDAEAREEMEADDARCGGTFSELLHGDEYELAQDPQTGLLEVAP